MSSSGYISTALSGSTGMSYSPRQIPGCVGWWTARDASTITIATGVSQWGDKSGFGNHLTQATAADQPTYTTSVSVDFNPANTHNLIAPAPIVALTTWEMFIVATSFSSNATWRALLNSGATTSATLLMLNIGGTQYGIWNGGFVQNGTNTWPNSTKKMARVKALGTQIYQSLDGNALTLTGSSGGSTGYSQIEGVCWPFQGFGNIHELILFNRELSETEADFIEHNNRKVWAL